jgi:TonB family protein
VENVDALSGDPILAKAAVGASKKYRFKPYIKNGKAVKVTAKLPFDFYFSDKVTNISAENTRVPPKDSPASNLPTDSAAAPESPKVIAGMLIRRIEPVYPVAARHNQVEGTVILRGVIRKDGLIGDLKPISGPEELIPAAVDAVQQWQFTPYVIKGQPVAVETEVSVNFHLQLR